MNNQLQPTAETPTGAASALDDGLEGWTSVENELPQTKPHSHMCEMSEKVLVRGDGKDQYPWVAHLHVDKAATYKTYAWGFDRDNIRYTWLSPYRDIADNQRITHWRVLPSNVKVSGLPEASPLDCQVGGLGLENFALNIFAGAELTDEIREELERKREEAIRVEEQDSNATR